VLMDVKMPVMDGLTATRQICKKHPYTQIILLTNSLLSDELLAIQNEGICKYVPKVASPQDIVKLIARA
jgi:CheY-like chemotaxis protein